MTGHLALTCAVFVGVYVAANVEPRAGAADSQLMVGPAVFAPLEVGNGAALEMTVFAVLRRRKQPGSTIAGALWLYLGALCAAVALITAHLCHRPA